MAVFRNELGMLRGGLLVIAQLLLQTTLQTLNAHAQDGWVLYDYDHAMRNRAMSCFDEDDCIVVGTVSLARGIIRSTKGGEIWSTLYQGESAPIGSSVVRYNDVARVSKTRTYVAGDGGQVV